MQAAASHERITPTLVRNRLKEPFNIKAMIAYYKVALYAECAPQKAGAYLSLPH